MNARKGGKVKIGVAQIRCRPCDVDANLDTIVRFAEKAKKASCEMVVFPEMVDTGYDPETIRNCASSWNEKPFRTLSGLASRLDMYLVAGISELDGDRLYNAVAVLGPDGAMAASYRKTHLITTEPICEQRLFSPGDALTVASIGGMKFGIMVCYDLRFPEIARTLAIDGVQAILVASAWPTVRVDHWKTLVRCRAIENQVYMVCANRVGIDGGLAFCGASCIVDPWGVTEGFASEDQEILITGDIDLDRISDIKKMMPIFEHRREDLY